MAVLMGYQTIESAAKDMAATSSKMEPALTRTYWFRDGAEIRLVHVDSTALPSERVTPFYFGTDPTRGSVFRSAIALVRPEEEGLIALPKAWGDWSDAVIWNWS